NGPDTVIGVSSDGPLAVGATVQLTGAEGTGHKWFKDGVPIKNIVPHIGGSNTRILTIQGLVQEDSGQYECISNDESLHLDVTYPYMLNVGPAEDVSSPHVLRMRP
ncbi:MAG TPA: immunoglobulin domain-containing protein, partial [Candidatus Hydrogenedentes bacterium]|nr:immunoglobulin domain-containing protein [Candidatus Hydrogenedentota bacterium]